MSKLEPTQPSAQLLCAVFLCIIIQVLSYSKSFVENANEGIRRWKDGDPKGALELLLPSLQEYPVFFTED